MAKGQKKSNKEIRKPKKDSAKSISTALPARDPVRAAIKTNS